MIQKMAGHYRFSGTPSAPLAEIPLDSLTVTTSVSGGADLSTTYQAFCIAAGINAADVYLWNDATGSYARKP